MLRGQIQPALEPSYKFYFAGRYIRRTGTAVSIVGSRTYLGFQVADAFLGCSELYAQLALLVSQVVNVLLHSLPHGTVQLGLTFDSLLEFCEFVRADSFGIVQGAVESVQSLLFLYRDQLH
jgi:hypothetical protein